MADGIVRITINAIDKYSGVLTGLNQGLEIASKAFQAFGIVADTVSKTISSGLDLAKIGGAFQEQRNQFENLANSYGVNGQKIINTVKATALNTISEFDSITVATKGLASGLSGGDLDTALSYIKRWTEATGQSFKQVSETVFTSLASGRYSVLRQMGLVIENGAKVQDVVLAMGEGLKRFGDSGFNAGDKIDALNASQDDLIRKFGQGINSSGKFQSVLSRVTDVVINLVNAFNPAPITAFVDFIIAGAEDMFNAFAKNFPKLGELFSAVFSIGTVEAGKFTKETNNKIFTILQAAAEVVEEIVKIITSSGITDGVATVTGFIIKSFSGIIQGVAFVAEKIVELFVGAGRSIVTFWSDLFANSPALAELIGVGPGDFNALNQSLDTIEGTVRGTVDDIINSFDKLDTQTGFLGDVGESFKDWKIDLSGVKASMDSINEEADKTAQNAGKTADSTKKTLEGLKKMEGDFSRVSKEAKKTADAVDDVTRKLSGADLNNLQAELIKINGILKTGSLGEGLRDFTPEERDKFTKRAKEINKILKENLIFDVGVNAEINKGKAGDDVSSYLASVNWPSEFQALGEFLINFALQKLRGENIPIALGAAT